jgi:hypothetical protein
MEGDPDDHIQRCLSALTAFVGALLAVFIMPAGPSVAVDRAMPNGGHAVW